MHRLSLLGRVDLVDPSGNELRSVLAQPRRLALLAYLAGNSGAHRRDQLFGLFWPEVNESRARKALNKSLHFLRQALGDDAVISRGPEDVEVDASRVWCDARAFSLTVEAGQLSQALELYRGDLLPSFYIEDAPAFESWVESERSRLRRLASRAATTLAQQRERDGQLTMAVGLARRAVEMSEDDERSFRQLLEMLDRLGDRAGALYAYDKFARRLAAELDAEPAPETRALIERVRERTEAAPVPVRLDATPKPTPRSSEAHASVADLLRSRGYEIERELGRGGMATVYLARDLKHGRHVALKVLAPEFGALRLADRFEAEIRVTAQLNHPNILVLFDSGSADGLLYYAMPYVAGESLRARLQRDKQLTVDEAIALITALASALEHAHAAGIVHRDIKPENILLQDGRPLLADFGIALALSSAGVERITSTGLSLGTPEYMSPEQAAGELTVGPQSDVYSLASVAYELLAGEPPFTGPNSRAVLTRVMLEQPRSIRTIRGTVPEQVESAILKALAKHPVDRFPSAAAFARGLRQTSQVPSRPKQAFVPRHFRTRAVAGFAGVAGLAGVAVLAWLQQPDAVVTQQGSAAANPNAATRIVVADFLARDDTLARVVRELVEATLSRSPGLATLSRDQLAGARRAALLANSDRLSLDNARHVALRTQTGLAVDGRVDRVGTNYTVLLHGVNARDGKTIATVQGTAHDTNLVTIVRGLAGGLARELRRVEVAAIPRISWIAATPSLEAFHSLLEAFEIAERFDYARALPLAQQALKHDPQFATAWDLLGYTYSQIGRGFDSVMFAYRQALQHEDRLTPSEKLYVQGMMAYRLGQQDSAVRLFDAALLEDPFNANVYHDRGLALKRLGRFDEAGESFGRAVAQPVTTGTVPLNSLATLLALNGQVDSARTVARKILPKEARLDAELYIAIASANWEEVRRIARSFASDPTAAPRLRAEMLDVIATTHVARGQLDSAWRTLEEAARIRPDPFRFARADILIGIPSGVLPAHRRQPGASDTMLFHPYFRAVWHASKRDSAAAAYEIGQLRGRIDPNRQRGLAEEAAFLERWIQSGASAPRAVVDFVAPRAWRGAIGMFGSNAMQRWLVADAYEQLGQLDSAAVYFELLVSPKRMPFKQSEQLGFFRPFALRRLALISEQTGQRKLARQYWTQFLKEFTNPDPALRPLVEEARDALRRPDHHRPLWTRVEDLLPRFGRTTFLPDVVVLLPLELERGVPALEGLARDLSNTLPEAIAREGVGEPVPVTTTRDLMARARGTPQQVADFLARETRSGIQLRGVCSGAARAATCQVDLLRMPSRALRMTLSVSGDPAHPSFLAEIRERILVALFLQRTWGDRVNWIGAYMPRSLAAARAFKQACCTGDENKNAPFYAQAARLDTGWVGAIAMAAFDSTEAVAESTFARLGRRPGLLERERLIVTWLTLEARLRDGKPVEAGRSDANALYSIHETLMATNPEWWSTGTAFWALQTFRPNAAIAASTYADSARAPRLPAQRPYTIRGRALHHLGRFAEQLDLARDFARRFPEQPLDARAHEVEALAGLGKVDALRSRLREWEATPEPVGMVYAGSRAYVAGVELMAHGHERAGREILATTIPLYRRLKRTEGRRDGLREVLMYTERYEEAQPELLDDLSKAREGADSVILLSMLGAAAAGLRQQDAASTYWNQVTVVTQRRNGKPLAAHPGRVAVALAHAAAWMNDGETAVRMLEHARAYARPAASYHFVHRDPAFARLRSYPAFKNYLKPRD